MSGCRSHCAWVSPAAQRLRTATGPFAWKRLSTDRYLSPFGRGCDEMVQILSGRMARSRAGEVRLSTPAGAPCEVILVPDALGVKLPLTTHASLLSLIEGWVLVPIQRRAAFPSVGLMLSLSSPEKTDLCQLMWHRRLAHKATYLPIPRAPSLSCLSSGGVVQYPGAQYPDRWYAPDIHTAASGRCADLRPKPGRGKGIPLQQ